MPWGARAIKLNRGYAPINIICLYCAHIPNIDLFISLFIVIKLKDADAVSEIGLIISEGTFLLNNKCLNIFFNNFNFTHK